MDEDAGDGLAGNVVLVDQLYWLKRVRLDHFEVGIAALEIIKTFNEFHGEGLSAILAYEDSYDIHDHLSFGEHSIRWLASETKSEILARHYGTNGCVATCVLSLASQLVCNVFNDFFWLVG